MYISRVKVSFLTVFEDVEAKSFSSNPSSVNIYSDNSSFNIQTEDKVSYRILNWAWVHVYKFLRHNDSLVFYFEQNNLFVLYVKYLRLLKRLFIIHSIHAKANKMKTNFSLKLTFLHVCTCTMHAIPSYS